MGTMHAEQRLSGVPTARPLMAPQTPPLLESRTPWGKRKAAVRPATRKAKIIPGATSSM